MHPGTISHPAPELEKIGEARTPAPLRESLVERIGDPRQKPRDPPSYEQSRVFRMWETLFHRRVDALTARGVKTLRRGEDRVQLARVHATFRPRTARELRAELAERQQPLTWEEERMLREANALGSTAEVRLTDGAGRDLGTFHQKELGFLGDPQAAPDLPRLRRVLRRALAGQDVEAIVIYARGRRVVVDGGRVRWPPTEAVSLYAPSFEHYELDGGFVKTHGPGYAIYQGRAVLGLLTRIFIMNRAEDNWVPSLEVEGLVAQTRWQAALRAYEFASGRSVPLAYIKYAAMGPRNARTPVRHPLDAFEGLPEQEAVACNYHALWDDENDCQREDCRLQDLRRASEFQFPKVGVDDEGAPFEFADP